MTSAGALLSRIGNVDVLSWNPLRMLEGESGARFVDNFGDLIGPALVERIVGLTGGDRQPVDGAAVPVLLSVGSTLHFAPAGSVVWGSGVNFKLASKLPEWVDTLDIRALRGPHSARAVTAAGGVAPAVFGDPALLLPRFMPELVEWRDRGRGGVVIVPNLNDFDRVRGELSATPHLVLDPRRPYHGVLRRIAESEFIVGSSLHAVAIADALGIPARFVVSAAEGPWKYRDYLSGTGRPSTRLAESVEEAISLGGHEVLDVDLDRLLDEFPHDLWDGSRPSGNRTVYADHPSVIAAWKDLLRAPQIDPLPLARRFLDELLPAAVEAAEREISATHTSRADAGEATVPYDVVDGAEAFFLAFGPEIVAATPEMSASQSRFSAATMTRAQLFAREVWLEREGPHALIHAARRDGDMLVVSIALRTGHLSNELVRAEVCVNDADGRTLSVEAPVFAMYRKQWSIDLTVAVPVASDVEISSLYVRYAEEGSEPVTLRVLDGGRHATDLRHYVSISDLPEWTGSTAARDDGDREGDE